MKLPKLVNKKKIKSLLIKKKYNLIERKKIKTSLKFNLFLITILVLGSLLLYMKYCFKYNKNNNNKNNNNF